MVVIPSWDEYFLGIARAVGTRGKCTRRQVGAVVVDPGRRVVATGYNGAPSGDADCLSGACPRGQFSADEVPPFSGYDDPKSPGFCIAIHAEVNALIYLRGSAVGHTIYITDPPCHGCMKVIRASRVARVVWHDNALDTRHESVL